VRLQRSRALCVRCSRRTVCRCCCAIVQVRKSRRCMPVGAGSRRGDRSRGEKPWAYQGTSCSPGLGRRSGRRRSKSGPEVRTAFVQCDTQAVQAFRCRTRGEIPGGYLSARAFAAPAPRCRGGVRRRVLHRDRAHALFLLPTRRCYRPHGLAHLARGRMTLCPASGMMQALSDHYINFS